MDTSSRQSNNQLNKEDRIRDINLRPTAGRGYLIYGNNELTLKGKRAQGLAVGCLRKGD